VYNNKHRLEISENAIKSEVIAFKYQPLCED